MGFSWSPFFFPHMCPVIFQSKFRFQTNHRPNFYWNFPILKITRFPTSHHQRTPTIFQPQCKKQHFENHLWLFLSLSKKWWCLPCLKKSKTTNQSPQFPLKRRQLRCQEKITRSQSLGRKTHSQKQLPITIPALLGQ